ncbi:hypothetical protein FB45DRAFT_1055244 [Roridomyces roridus]|uniref:CASTOR ACT domain-containing protein n=1 Tax=Roridomyces roridus TaxID=1738132 RepID=A0AAD7C542_9AGAR|nr:hypothetical protein FB45DRAFT_1055244 [Roridomyces roridus]
MPGQKQITISITRLPQTVSVVSIPRARLDALSHPLLRVLLKPNPSFLSIICNSLELALYAELDAHSIRAFRSASDQAAAVKLEISEDQWSVLQIDSHSDQLDNAGARVNELSAPLAAAGISILYQSSYMSDFIFVKEQRLAEAMSLFAAAGFALYAADPNLLTALLAPPPPTPTRERSDSAPLPSTRKSSSRSRKGKANSTPLGNLKNNARPLDADPVRSVRLLAQNLACVGLAEDSADYWALKIIKLVAFQDLVPLPSPRPPKTSIQEDADDDGYFSHSPTPEPEAKEEIPEAEENENDLVPPFDAREVPSRLAELPTSLAWLPRTPPDTDGAISEEPDDLPMKEPVIPFFSFTRTPEGSSITAGARVLAALFPPAERHMVICAGELDAADDAQWDDGVADVDSDGEDSDIEEDEDDEVDGPLLCALQVDLRTPGLDTHGIVHRISHALAQGGVNHMYASTLRSANLLVPAGRARRGARLLRAC